MPWAIQRDDRCPVTKLFAVVLETTGRLEGCHPTWAKTRTQQEALYASESKAVSEAWRTDATESAGRGLVVEAGAGTAVSERFTSMAVERLDLFGVFDEVLYALGRRMFAAP